ncbi:MAG TPA: hypothetical protein VGV38_16260, partial [Pyrinomonadaceae bacterium]|nr:hypothetical protein [Pyrinomonadaceae bacterium]
MKPRVLLTAFFVLLLSPLTALAEEWIPFNVRAENTEVRVWTSLGVTYARVRITFSDGGHRVVDWGRVTRSGNNLSIDLAAERWTGASIQMVTIVENSYTLGELPAVSHTLTVRSRGTALRSVTFNPAQAGQGWGPTTLPPDRIGHFGFSVRGESTFRLYLKFPDFGHEVADWGQPVREGNNFTFDLKIDRFTGAPSPERITQTFHEYPLGQLPDGTYTAAIKIRGETVKVVTFHLGPVVVPTNPIDQPGYFTRQQYLDFLNREPDAAGLAFWQDHILRCNGVAPCVEASRIHVSASFFLAIEFHETGFLVQRLYKAAYGREPRFAEFLPD